MSTDAPRKPVTRALREYLFARSAGRCERCGCAITFETFHVAHLRAHASGGPAIQENLAAWCARCNLQQGKADVMDTRTPAREWQLEALEKIVARIMASGVATLSAAPGAGKTIFTGLTAQRLMELDLVDRMIILVPRNALVSQWEQSLLRHCHLQLRCDSAYERDGQAGVVVTYHSLNAEQLRNHVGQVRTRRTLLVLDEVHHVGEPVRAGGRVPGWARAVTELAGYVDTQLHVAAVLNLSGTLWRSLPGQRISTVRYETQADGKLLSLVDFDIDAPQLIREKQLRPIDLRRLGARVQLNDYRDQTTIDSHTADLNEKHGRATLRGLANIAEWRRDFVGAVLDRLKIQAKSLGGYHVKALIVAVDQNAARALCATAQELMRERRWSPLVAIATSDEKDAQDTLEHFKKSRQSGVLCTVDMAGEGYDCPDICVIGYASNKQTPLYIRQVVARAQRVTEREREPGRDVIPAVVVVPDVPDLIRLLVGILKPMHHEIIAPEAAQERAARDDIGSERLPALGLASATPDAEQMASIADDENFKVAGATVTHVENAMDAVGLPPSHATRTIHAVLTAAKTMRDAQPFEPVDPMAEQFELVGQPPEPQPARSSSVPLSANVMHKKFRRINTKLSGWWTRNGDASMPVATFAAKCNQAAGIPVGGRDDASVEQLRAAARHGGALILQYCERAGIKPPDFQRWLEDESE